MRARTFTPSREPVEALRARTVGREDALLRIERSLASAAQSGNRSHVLVVGPRGSGKSHLLEIALDRASSRDSLMRRLAFAVLPEDAVGLTRLDDVLDEALLAIGGGGPDRSLSTADRQARISHLLDGRVLVLVIENLDRVMAALGEADERGLRGWIETSREVLILATTPLLFAGVRDRERPWFNAFDIVRLPGLTPQEGHRLLEQSADYDADGELADYLATQQGRDRVRALAELTGGSPRIWTILRGCLTPRSLDELVPAVEDLLEELTPYYQQLLWELPAQHQRIVRALAEGDSATMTVAEIAEASGEAKGTSTLVRRLVADNWVEQVTTDAPDKRRAWYRLREPLLRHHFQYRSRGRGVLALVVTFLKLAFMTEERRRHLALAAPESSAFAHLSETFRWEQRRADAAYADRDVDALQGEARLWMGETGPWSYAETGRIVDDLVRSAREESGSSEGLEERVGRRLRTAAKAAKTPRSKAHLTLIALCWLREDAATIAPLLKEALSSLAETDPLSLLVREEIAYWTGESGEHATARDLFAVLVTDRTRILGPDHPDTLTTRHNHAYETGETGDHATARDLFAALIDDRTRALGPDHPDTLTTRHNHAYETGETGDHATARDLCAMLANDCARALGPDHLDTLDTRHGHAFEVGQTGDHTNARDLYATLVNDYQRVLGPDHLDTLRSRHEHANEVGQTGDHGTARDLHATLVADDTRIFGPDDLNTLIARHNHASQTAKAGDHTRARDLFAQLVADRPLVRGGCEELIGHRYFWAREQVAVDLTESLRMAFNSSRDGGRSPDRESVDLLRMLALEEALRLGTPTGIPLVDLVIEAKRGSEEALTRLPEELRNALPLLPEPPPA